GKSLAEFIFQASVETSNFSSQKLMRLVDIALYMTQHFFYVDQLRGLRAIGNALSVHINGSLVAHNRWVDMKILVKVANRFLNILLTQHVVIPPVFMAEARVAFRRMVSPATSRYAQRDKEHSATWPMLMTYIAAMFAGLPASKVEDFLVDNIVE